MTRNFKAMMEDALIEREVEDIYNRQLTFYFDNSAITHPFDCDGLIDTKVDGRMLKLIMEYKYDRDFKSRAARAGVIVQALYYIKKFEQNGMILPNVVLVGDRNECFVFHVNDIISYLDENVDWGIAPSSAAERNPDLVLKMANDENLNPFVFEIGEGFDFKVVAEKIRDLAMNVQRYVHVTEHNIATIFEYFKSRVVKDTKISANELVSIFLGVIKNDENVYVQPNRKNTLVAFGKSIQIDGMGFKSFAGYFSRKYTPTEKMRFDEIADRLIEDTSRRKSGDFWTPTLFCDYAHKMISEQLGEDWREKYVVWDPACGSKNLTRDYKFRELYCSTLFDSELQIGSRYNPEATSFQFDFLNDYIPMPDEILHEATKIPAGLLNALKNDKPIVFLLNPPYGTACNRGTTSSHKAGINDTNVRRMMIQDSLASGAENIQHQFMYRICKLKRAYNLSNVHVCLFSNPIYMTGGKQKAFLDFWCDNFKFKKGCMFQASHFADVSGIWGITFNIWSNGKTENVNEFVHDLIDEQEGEIVMTGEKTLYNLNGMETASDWVKEPVKKLKTFDVPQMSSGLKVKEDGCGTLIENALGYFVNAGNGVYKNGTDVYLLSSTSSMGHGCSINGDNFCRVCDSFASRRLIENTWTNHNNEYMKPKIYHVQWSEFESDAVIYSLFESKSNQSSLRNVEYKGRRYDIKNEFFWMPRSKMMELAEENSNDAVYDDARTSNERYVCTWLQAHELSPEAQAVLDKATELVVMSFKYRTLFNEDHPEYHINTWDAGYYQLKALWQQYLPDEFQEFKRLYKVLADKMRPMVYELGFLRK